MIICIAIKYTLLNLRPMKKLLILTLLFTATAAIAQTTSKEKVVIMNRNYVYEDPRWEQSATLPKGEAIIVQDVGTAYEYWPYPAADVRIPKNVAHVPGTVKGERYLVINGTNVRLREGPSLRHGYYCINVLSGASVYHNQFVTDKNKPKVDEWGLEAEWEPYYLPKGTRIPYLGRQGDFYKTKIDGVVFYISAKFCLLK